MYAIEQNQRDGSDVATRDVLAIGGGDSRLATASLVESLRSVTPVSGTESTEAAGETEPVRRSSGAGGLRTRTPERAGVSAAAGPIRGRHRRGPWPDVNSTLGVVAGTSTPADRPRGDRCELVGASRLPAGWMRAGDK